MKKNMYIYIYICTGFPGGSVVKTPSANAGDSGLIPQSGRSPGEGNGNPLQYSCLENPVDRGAWWASVHRVTQSQTQLKRLGMHACMHWRRKCQPTPVFLLGKAHGQRSLVGYSQTGKESDVT